MTTTTATTARILSAAIETEALAFRVFADTLTHDGSTVSALDPYASTPRRGYAVALPHAEWRIPAALFDLDSVRMYVATHATEVLSGDVFVGSWVDNGYVFLDLSIVITERTDAETIGRQNAQLAIFDLNTFETISL